MNAPIPQSILSQDPLEQYQGQVWSTATKMPKELRLALLGKAIEISKKSILDSEKRVAALLQVQDLSRVLNIIDEVNSTRLENADKIEVTMGQGLGTSFDGVLLRYLPEQYSVGRITIKAPAFIALSDALSRAERPFIWVPVPSEVDSMRVKEKVAGQIGSVITAPVTSSNALPKGSHYTLKDIGNMKIWEILEFNTTTLRGLLEDAFDGLKDLYESQILSDMDEIWSSFNALIPTHPLQQISYWTGFIIARFSTDYLLHSGELNIFLAFRQLDPRIQEQIIEAMRMDDPILDDIARDPDPQQSALF